MQLGFPMFLLCHAVKVLGIYENSKNYISDQEIIDYAAEVKKILSVEKPYSFIPKLEEYDNKLWNAIMKLLEKDTQRIQPDVYADWKAVKTSIPSDRPYAQRLLDRINPKFQELIDKLEKITDIATLNGIPAESNALLQNCLRISTVPVVRRKASRIHCELISYMENYFIEKL